MHIIWNDSVLGIFAHDGQHIITYPRPQSRGGHCGPKTAPQGTPMTGSGPSPSTGTTATTQRTASKGGDAGCSPASSTPATSAKVGSYHHLGHDNGHNARRRGVDDRALRRANLAARVARTREDLSVNVVLRHANIHDVLRQACARSPETSQALPATLWTVKRSEACG